MKTHYDLETATNSLTQDAPSLLEFRRRKIPNINVLFVCVFKIIFLYVRAKHTMTSKQLQTVSRKMPLLC